MKKFSSINHMANEGQKNQRLLVAYKGTVYDITDFQNLHPAGRSPLQTHKGKELENILFNPQIHRHSRTILNTLELYKIGHIETKLSSPSPMNSTTGTKTTALTNSQSSQQKTQLKKTETTPQKSPVKMQNQAEAIKKSESHTERLNQSFSMTSSQKFLAPPNHQDIIKLQKIKQQKLMQEWKQKEIEEIKRQQEVIKQEQLESRKVQSEIFSNSETRKKINPYYQQWLDSKKKSELESQTSLQQSLTQSVQNVTEKKKPNPYYEEWKKKQMQTQQQQQQTKRKSINVITEEDESLISPSVNNSFQRSQSAVSSRKSMANEEPQLQVPQFTPKFLAQIKKKYS